MSPLTEIKRVLTMDSEPRAIGISIRKPGTDLYISLVLIEKRQRWLLKSSNAQVRSDRCTTHAAIIINSVFDRHSVKDYRRELR